MLWFNKKTIGIGYLTRWHIIPRNRWFNIYLHRFTGDDYDRALHDHPWWSLSIRLKGQLREHYQIVGWWHLMPRTRMAPRICFRPAKFLHRLELASKSPAWTIFITGKRVREWGFLCPKGWVHWSKITDSKGNIVGGCDGS